MPAGGRVKEINIQTLAEEAMKLLRLEADELYATLGGQLLAHNLPTRVAGIMSYLSAVRNASEAKGLYEELSGAPSMSEWGGGLGIIYERLKRDGTEFFEGIKPDLRKSLCNEDILHLSEQVNVSTVQIVIMVVSAALRMPREFDPISVTIVAILFKLGLRNFCLQG